MTGGGVVWVVVGMLLIHGATFTLQDCQHCDCTLSSEEDHAWRAIQSAKLTCISGTLHWTSAYSGGLRLEVNPSPRPASYRLCLLVHSRHVIALVSRETPQNPRPRNHRLGQEERPAVRMEPLVKTSEDGQGVERCVDAGREPLWLFVEVERSSDLTGIPSVSLQYDVQPLQHSERSDPWQECRPCTEEEILEAYCTSDFVVVGTIHSVENEPEATKRTETGRDGDGVLGEGISQLQVRASQLIQQTTPLFQRRGRQDSFLQGTVLAPAKCGIRAGSELLLITGRTRLGRPRLTCAPFFNDWIILAPRAECVY